MNRTALRQPLRAIVRQPLWDGAYAALRSALLEGRYAPGQRIVLREVADQLGISLTPVRDAVNRLIAEHVLERGGVGPSGAATVPLLDADQFDQLMAVRASLEPLAAAHAALHATPEALAPIEAALHEMKRTVAEGRLEHYLEAHHRFHFGIYALCRMPIVMEIVEGAWLRCAPTLTLALPDYIPGLKRHPLHAEALQALRDGDGPLAASAIRRDIESARDDIGPLLQQRATQAAAAD